MGLEPKLISRRLFARPLFRIFPDVRLGPNWSRTQVKFAHVPRVDLSSREHALIDIKYPRTFSTRICKFNNLYQVLKAFNGWRSGGLSRCPRQIFKTVIKLNLPRVDFPNSETIPAWGIFAERSLSRTQNALILNQFNNFY